jgi:hypothetical protein
VIQVGLVSEKKDDMRFYYSRVSSPFNIKKILWLFYL